jgi:hypothetical protein
MLQALQLAYTVFTSGREATLVGGCDNWKPGHRVRSAFLSAAVLALQVYANLQPQAYFLQLANDGAGLTSAWEAFRALEQAVGVLNWYYALNGISILLLIARWVMGRTRGGGRGGAAFCMYLHWIRA